MFPHWFTLFRSINRGVKLILLCPCLVSPDKVRLLKCQPPDPRSTVPRRPFFNHILGLIEMK